MEMVIRVINDMLVMSWKEFMIVYFVFKVVIWIED